jgi:hypothetical protein
VAAGEGTPVLMILEREKSMIPVAPLAFRAAQTPRDRLNETYRGALIIAPDGAVHPIQGIEVKGLWGKSLGRKLISALSGAYEIDVQFGEPIEMSPLEFKELVIHYLEHDRERGEPYLPLDAPPERVYQGVRAATSFAHVFEVINVPEPEDCLDLL